MSKKCDICGKGTLTGNSVSHSHRKSRREWKPNVKKMRIVEGSLKVNKKVCSRCLRSNKVQKAL